MVTVSLCMIVKNEEEVLARCLDSIKGIADEIIIVDTGSTDHTKEIAAGYTQKVFDFDWIDNFSAARNYSFDQAEMDYCMWLDADDIILEEDREKLLELKQTMDGTDDMVMMKYNTAFDQHGNPTFSYYRERLLRRAKGFRWVGVIHEVIAPTGKLRYSDAAITHRKLGSGDPDRNLRIFEKQIENGVELDPREQFYYARELYYHQRYQDAIRVFDEFLNSGKGWVENCIDACQQLAYCYYGLGNHELALRSLLRSLVYDEPRAELCCSIGKHFYDRDSFAQAAFWYETALTRKMDECSGSFIQRDCYDYVPNLQLCVCYFRMGDIPRAIACNELAAKCKPEDSAVRQNREFFKKLQEV